MNPFCKNAEVLSNNAYSIDKDAISADLLNDLIEIILRCINMLKKKKIDTYECVGPEIFTLYEIIKFSGFIQGERQWLYRYQNF